jgi:hypothetical protein
MNEAQHHRTQGRIARAIERRLGERYQRYLFWRSMRRFMRATRESRELDDPRLLSDLVRGWGNSWSAQLEYLEGTLSEVRRNDGPILECGSGLSTLLIGAIAQTRGASVWSLEHEPRWAERVQKYLHQYGIYSVTVCMAPLRSYGEFDWYGLSALQPVPNGISLVICDGPPGSTRGGRLGLVPVMLEKLRADCTILLDDGARAEERAIAERWASMLAGEAELIGTEKPYFRVRAGQKPVETMNG